MTYEFAIVIHGISLCTAGLLHDGLLPSMAYLGWKKLDFEHEAHAALLGEFPQDCYLIKGRTVEIARMGSLSDEGSLPDHRIETLKV